MASSMTERRQGPLHLQILTPELIPIITHQIEVRPKAERVGGNVLD
jgi:hypothetical protein